MVSATHASAETPVPTPIRVAIVDDFRLVTDGLASRLSDKEFGLEVVLQASSWAELVVHSEFPAQVTVLDLQLNDSIAIGTKINALSAAGSNVVVMSRHADLGTVARVMKAGALGFVPKTEPVEELVASITAAAHGTVRLSPDFTSAIERMVAGPRPKLGPREQLAITLYSRGLTVSEVAVRMGTTDETVKSYIKRARRKFRGVGIDLGNRRSLRDYGLHEGWLET